MSLSIRNVTKRFGGLVALDDVSLELDQGQIIGLIGPNGSGKTTLINVISGFYRPDKGEIYINNKRIDHLSPHQIALRRVGRTFQIAKPLGDMSTFENVLVAGLAHGMKEEQAVKRAEDLLKFFGIGHVRNENSVNLSGGQKNLLELARICVTDPLLILLDEPFEGINPTLKEEIKRHLKQINKTGVSLLLISHDIGSVIDLCPSIAVMDSGRIIVKGSYETIRNDKRIVEAYMGA